MPYDFNYAPMPAIPSFTGEFFKSIKSEDIRQIYLNVFGEIENILESDAVEFQRTVDYIRSLPDDTLYTLYMSMLSNLNYNRSLDIPPYIVPTDNFICLMDLPPNNHQLDTYLEDYIDMIFSAMMDAADIDKNAEARVDVHGSGFAALLSLLKDPIAFEHDHQNLYGDNYDLFLWTPSGEDWKLRRPDTCDLDQKVKVKTYITTYESLMLTNAFRLAFVKQAIAEISDYKISQGE